MVLDFFSAGKVETNIFHFSCAISACEKLADWSMALEILRKMKERQVPKFWCDL